MKGVEMPNKHFDCSEMSVLTPLYWDVNFVTLKSIPFCSPDSEMVAWNARSSSISQIVLSRSCSTGRPSVICGWRSWWWVYCLPIGCFSFHLTGQCVQLGSQPAALGACGCASPLHIRWDPVTSEILEPSLEPTASDTTLMGGRWANFLTRLGHHFSHWSHSSLQTEIQFGFEYRDTWWWIHLLQCLFWPKVYFSSAFSKSKWWKHVILACMTKS